MSALPLGYDQPAPQEVGPTILDIIEGGGGGGCFPQPEPQLPLGLIDPWDDGGCFGDPSPWPGLPYDLFGEDNGDSGGGLPFGLLDESTIDDINNVGGGGGGILGGIGTSIKGMIDRAGKAAGAAGGGLADWMADSDGGGCIPQYKSSFEDMIVY